MLLNVPIMRENKKNSNIAFNHVHYNIPNCFNVNLIAVKFLFADSL
jgi:hypothetical protein